MFDNLLTVDELAKRWKISKSWIYARTMETGAGAMPRIKMGKYLRFDPAEVDAWLKKQNESMAEN